jgi:peptidyl-prolyl cis-trans isomerase D
MLSQLRSARNMKIIMGIVAVAFIAGTIILTYDPFGNRGSQQRSNAAVVINGEEVGWQSYTGVVNQLAEIERSRYQRQDLTTADYERIEQQAMESVITDVLMRQEADRLGLTASDDEIVATLTQNPPEYIRQRFLDDQGQFDPVQYQRALADPTYPWRQDEEYLRNALPTLKLQQMIRARAVVSEIEVRREFQRRNMRNTVRYTGVAWRTLGAEGFEPTDEQLRQYQQDHAERFQKRESVSLEMLRVAKSPSNEDKAEILADARQDLQDLSDGVYDSFAELAAFASEDPGQGRLGWSNKGTLPDTVESVVWSLQPGQHTAPILTNRGVYIVHVDSARTRDDARQLYLHQVYMALTPSLDTMDSLRATALDLADEATVDFDAAAGEFGLQIEKPEPLTTGGFLQGFGFSTRLRDWAFDAAVGAIGGPFASDDAWIMVRVVSKNPPELLPFEQVKDRLRSGLLEEHKKDVAHRRVESVRQAIDAGKTLQEAAAEAGLEIKQPAPFTFYESVAGIGNANAFTAVASELDAGQISGVVDVPTGSYIIELISRDPFDEELYAQEHNSHYQVLFQQRANAIYESWLKDLREHARIEDKRGPRV